MANYRCMTWEQVLELANASLVTFGSHTVNHEILSKLSDTSALRELSESRSVMETKLGSPVELFVYPNGRDIDYNEGSIELLRNVGYCSAVTAVPGFNIPEHSPFRLRRVPVSIMGQQFHFPYRAGCLFPFSVLVPII